MVDMVNWSIGPFRYSKSRFSCAVTLSVVTIVRSKMGQKKLRMNIKLNLAQAHDGETVTFRNSDSVRSNS